MSDLKPLKILLAEDNEDHAFLTKSTLMENNAGNEIFHVTNGEDVILYLKREKHFAEMQAYMVADILLLDIQMPKMNGIEVLEVLRSDDKFNSLPIIMLTTSDNRMEIKKSFELGANSYVTKPVDFDEFVEKIKCIDRYWSSVTEVPPSG